MCIILAGCQTSTENTYKKGEPANNTPKIIGAMKNVMRKGELFATINIDTISNKKHLYGMGPVEYLTGEIIIVDGRCYKSVVTSDTTMQVTETMDIKAPFFGYANIDEWAEYPIPDTIRTLLQLEAFLNETTKQYPRPFFFKLTATVDSADVHIVNLPKGTKVSSPEEAHRGQRNFGIKNKNVELAGFFSTEHKTIFTHHDTYMHIHLITDDRKQMGHLEELNIKKGTAKLYLPRL
jgi:acetolactate decarboxylase